ncbi:hypothetical protein FDI69_gp135 [Rhodococcus phage Trina]|uniref:Uncharacterized protein n=1 Tax=Rhodococcus phage Trina TaxID=2027905 RepID=A0A2D1A729_9CAUD|nr:hypothetical protein FDI69_gp135 [Rhodococcus phage Trina]ASZ75050.1 hypothetical protein SEA_TRINA_272 [Rhodococcus phage Trina]
MLKSFLIHNPSVHYIVDGTGNKDDRDFDEILTILEQNEKDGFGTFLFRDSNTVVYCTQANVIWKYVDLS